MVRVIGVDEFGGPEKLKTFDIPDQPVGSGHVRVCLLYTSDAADE